MHNIFPECTEILIKIQMNFSPPRHTLGRDYENWCETRYSDYLIKVINIFKRQSKTAVF
jgi:hypothetical protein